jgi:type II secretory pathway component PulC
VRTQPVYEGERFAGLRLLPGRNGGKFAELGLASGDVVRGIDGKRLSSPDESWQMLDDALSAGASIVISVERDGNLISMHLDGARLAEDAATTPVI